jgi:hypothetical protein
MRYECLCPVLPAGTGRVSLSSSCIPSRYGTRSIPIITTGHVSEGRHPFPWNKAHSSQEVPFGKVHTPYSLPSGLSMSTGIPPDSSQKAAAGFAIPAVDCGPGVSTGVLTGVDDGAFSVHPDSIRVILKQITSPLNKKNFAFIQQFSI